MTFGEVKDLAREHFGRTTFPTSMLDLALKMGRKEIENTGNYWWMKANNTKATVIAQQAYNLLVATTNGFNMPNFKDIRRIYWKDTTDNSWDEIPVGDSSREDLELMYNTDDVGDPEVAVIDVDTLVLFPIPSAVVDLRIFSFEWTANPSNTESDELTKNFPMALVYSAIMWGCDEVLHDSQAAVYWQKKLYDQIPVIKRHNFKREWRDKVMLVPRAGPGPTPRRRLDNIQIYGR